MLEGPVAGTIAELTVPALLGNVAMMLLAIVDAFFVGKLGTEALAAIGFSFPIIIVIIAISTSVGAGATSIISRAAGEKNYIAVKTYTTDTLIFTTGLGILLTVIGLLTIEPLFTLMGASPAVMPFVKAYMVPTYLGALFFVIPLVGQYIIRSVGDAKMPAMFLVLAAILNLALDPLLIFGVGPFPELGIRGAAYATVISWFISTIGIIWIIIKREKLLTDVTKSMITAKDSWSKLMFVSIPATVSALLHPLAIAIVIGFASVFGDATVAALGIGFRIEPLAAVLGSALATSLPPFIGQNWGAKKWNRIEESLRKSIRFGILWQLSIFALLLFGAEHIAQLFTKDPAVIEVIRHFLYIIPFGYAGYIIVQFIGSSFNAINRPYLGLTINIIRLFVFYVPLVIIGSRIWGLWGIFYGAALGNILGGVVAYFFGRHIFYNKTTPAD